MLAQVTQLRIEEYFLERGYSSGWQLIDVSRFPSVEFRRPSGSCFQKPVVVKTYPPCGRFAICHPGERGGEDRDCFRDALRPGRTDSIVARSGAIASRRDGGGWH